MSAAALSESSHPYERPSIVRHQAKPSDGPARTPVRLMVWGHTPADADDGERDAQLFATSVLWIIIDVERDVGGTPPAPSGDGCLASRADYGWSWAAYLI